MRGRKRFTVFCSRLIKETVYQISSESPEFYGRYYKKHFGLFFSGHTLHMMGGHVRRGLVDVRSVKKAALIKAFNISMSGGLIMGCCSFIALDFVYRASPVDASLRTFVEPKHLAQLVV